MQTMKIKYTFPCRNNIYYVDKSTLRHEMKQCMKIYGKLIEIIVKLVFNSLEAYRIVQKRLQSYQDMKNFVIRL